MSVLDQIKALLASSEASNPETPAQPVVDSTPPVGGITPNTPNEVTLDLSPTPAPADPPPAPTPAPAPVQTQATPPVVVNVEAQRPNPVIEVPNTCLLYTSPSPRD